MSKGLGALVFVAGVAVLGVWGANSHAVSIERKITEAAENAVAGSVHPMEVLVSGRDITLSGTADTTAELDAIVARLDAVPGRRVVNAERTIVLPEIAPYETALAKAEDGSLVATGYAPSRAALDALTPALPAVMTLPLGHGAPQDWRAALLAGKAALAPLDQGSFALTGRTLTLQGIAATPVEDQTARGALAQLDGFDRVIAIDVLDPGVVDFSLSYDANEGFGLDGVVPAALGAGGIAAALGASDLAGESGTTFAELPGLSDTLAGLRAQLGAVEAFTLRADNNGAKLEATTLPGLNPESVAASLAGAVGGEVSLTVNAPAMLPEDGAERVNAATGQAQFAFGGVWMNRPSFEPSKSACTAAAMQAVEAAPIRFVTGSATLDPGSLATVNDLAAIIHLCTRDAGMRVTIGGHTDAQGDDTANYSLSLARARAVLAALAARGVAESRMTAIGYGETEPIADNDTEEGRAKNRRTTFAWPD